MCRPLFANASVSTPSEFCELFGYIGGRSDIVKRRLLKESERAVFRIKDN